MNAYKTFYHSPIGLLEITGTDKAITSIHFADTESEKNENMPVLKCLRQIDSYFKGEIAAFSVDLDLSGTAFQKQVWKAVKSIPYGETRTYSDIAASIGSPKAVRAVGTAIGRNPAAIVLPCHRVKGKNNSLTGYAWGTWRKEWLLGHESGKK
jgi:methylated-DNA-[protein]-cysteine S-methyltransferase